MHIDVGFDLDLSLCCGQVFRWKKIGDWWYGVVGETVFRVCQNGCDVQFEGVDEGFIRYYFGLNDNLQQIGESIGKDDYVCGALYKFKGLRIVRQNPWECLISFICATYKSIAAIELMLDKLSEKFGQKRIFNGLLFYTFPSAEVLAFASEKGLRECGLGYRAKYVQATAKKVYYEKINLCELKFLPYLEAKKIILDFAGVGLKVADCVLLFSLEKMEAFPVDVWVKRVILNHYANKLPHDFVEKLRSHDSLTNTEYEKIGAFARNYFGAYAGYAQEYLYHFERTQR